MERREGKKRSKTKGWEWKTQKKTRHKYEYTCKYNECKQWTPYSKTGIMRAIWKFKTQVYSAWKGHPWKKHAKQLLLK